MKFLFFIILFTLSNNSWCFELLCPKRINSDLNQKYMNTVLVDIYKMIGVKASIKFLSEEEINKRIKNNNFDAIVSKISDEKSIKHGLKVSPPLIKTYKIFRWILKGSHENKKRYSIGAIKGVLAHSKTIIKNRKHFMGVQYFSSYKDMIDALKSKIIDSILLSELEYQNELSPQLKSQFIKTSKELLNFSLHHYLNIKHQKFFAKLEKEFERREKLKQLSFEDFLKLNKKKP